jgi:hypothetical protein
MDNNNLEELKERNRVLQDQVAVLREQPQTAPTPAADEGAAERAKALEDEVAELRRKLKAGGSDELKKEQSKKLAAQKELLQKCKKTISCVSHSKR